MAQGNRIDLDLDERCIKALIAEARRLDITPEDVARRAVHAWLAEMCDDQQPVPERVRTIAPAPAVG